jgi:hypothetical protein
MCFIIYVSKKGHFAVPFLFWERRILPDFAEISSKRDRIEVVMADFLAVAG